mgnify:FL=1|jgi:hypothetical protein
MLRAALRRAILAQALLMTWCLPIRGRAGVSGGRTEGSKSREREQKRDGRKVVRACRFLEFAVHGSGVTVPDPFEEKDERIDRSGVRKSSVSRVE